MQRVAGAARAVFVEFQALVQLSLAFCRVVVALAALGASQHSLLILLLMFAAGGHDALLSKPDCRLIHLIGSMQTRSDDAQPKSVVL